MPPHISQISKAFAHAISSSIEGGNAAQTETKSKEKKVDRKEKKRFHTRFKNTNQHEIHY
jgi:hypothetical protein